MECERSDPGDALRQGDILAAQPGSDLWANPWTRFGVVISADCDLAHGKTGPTLVFIPIISHYTYLRDMWTPSECGALVQAARTSIEKQLLRLNPTLQYRHVKAWVTDGTLQTRLVEQSGGQLTADKAPSAAKKLSDLLEAINGLEAILDQQLIDRSLDTKAILDTLMRHRSVVNATTDAAQLVEGALRTLPDRLDIFLIRELLGLDPDMQPDTQFGFVVPLRRFSLMPIEQIELDRAKWYDRKDACLRICRLRGIYKSDLVQKFSNLFVRVGLEDHRDDEHRRLFRRCAQSLFPSG